MAVVQAVWNEALLAESGDYYTVTVDGLGNRDAAWCYRRPSPLARRIRGRVAFWRGVELRVLEEGAASR